MIEPRDLTEEIVAGIWADILDVEPVSVDANFFDVGGDSLRGVQLIACVEETFRARGTDALAHRVAHGRRDRRAGAAGA